MHVVKSPGSGKGSIVAPLPLLLGDGSTRINGPNGFKKRVLACERKRAAGEE